MKFKELKALPQAELRGKITELRKELMKENAQVAIGTVPKNPRKLRLAKKTIARIETILAVAQTKPADKVSAPKEAPKK
jgi:ribosomal protein L29